MADSSKWSQFPGPEVLVPSLSWPSHRVNPFGTAQLSVHRVRPRSTRDYQPDRYSLGPLAAVMCSCVHPKSTSGRLKANAIQVGRLPQREPSGHQAPIELPATTSQVAGPITGTGAGTFEGCLYLEGFIVAASLETEHCSAVGGQAVWSAEESEPQQRPASGTCGRSTP